MSITPQPLSKVTIFITGGIIFFVIIASAFYASYLLAKKSSQKAFTPVVQPIEISKNKQVQKITFKNTNTGEVTELWADGTVNQYDKFGNRIKSGRRGFAETQSKFRDLEKLINSHQNIGGFQGYIITIDTEQGAIVINPGDQGGGGSVIDDLDDFIDNTLHPTPRPSSLPTTHPSPIPTNTPAPTPTDENPNPTPAPEFQCIDYYKTGKLLKISNIICGPSPSPNP